MKTSSAEIPPTHRFTSGFHARCRENHAHLHNRLKWQNISPSFRAHDITTRRGLHEQLVCGVAKILDAHLALTLIWSRQLALVMTWDINSFTRRVSMIFITSKRDVGFPIITYRACACLTAPMQEISFLQTLYGDGYNGRVWTADFKMSDLSTFDEFDRW